MWAGRKLGHSRAGPPQPRVLAQADGFVRRCNKRARPDDDLPLETFECGGAQRAAMDAFRPGIGGETEPFELADMFRAERDRSGIIQPERQLLFIAQVTHQERRAPVDEALREPFVQGVRETILDRSRHPLPMRGIARPGGAMGGIGPGADLGEPSRKRIDVALDGIEPSKLPLEPIFRQHAFITHQVAEDLAHEARMLVGRELAEIRQLASLPEQTQLPRYGSAGANVLILRQHQERHVIRYRTRAAQAPRGRQSVEGQEQLIKR